MIFLGVICTTFLCAVYFFPEFWNGNSEYEFKILRHGKWSGFLIVLLIVPFLTTLIFWLWKNLILTKAGKKSLYPATSLIIFIAGVFTQLIYSEANRYGVWELAIRVYVEDHTGYFTDAVRLKSVDKVISNYKEESFFKLSTHSRTHPPLPIIFFIGLKKIASLKPLLKIYQSGLFEEREKLKEHFGIEDEEQLAGIMGAIMIIISGALTLVFGFLITTRFYPIEICFLGSLLLSLSPAFSHKAPVMDQVFAFFLLLGLWLVIIGYQMKKKLFFFASGLIFGLGLWLSPTFMSFPALIIAILSALELKKLKNKEKPFTKKNWLISGICLVCGLIIPLVLIGATVGIDYLSIYKLNRLGWEFNNRVSLRFSIWKWILFNPYEYLFWLGMPLSIGTVIAGYDVLKSLVKKKWKEIDEFGFLILSLAIALDLSGQLCYESPRLLWFLHPFISAISVKATEPYWKSLHSLGWLYIIALFVLNSLIYKMIF